MTPIRESVEISRRPEDVFAYLDDLDRHDEWQEQLVGSHVEQSGPTKVGTRATDTRRMGKRERKMTYEITEHDPPRSFAFRGIDGPIRANGRGTVESLDGGARARVTIELEFEGHGFGKLMVPLVKRMAQKQIPQDHVRLKERLESGAA